jgi:hypothetical protein
MCSGVLSVWTVTYGDVNPQLTAIASQYGNVSSGGHAFQGDATGPDVTGKAVVDRTVRIVLVVVLFVMWGVLVQWLGSDVRSRRVGTQHGRGSGQPQLQR